MPIQNVVFDLGRVMIEWEPWSVVEAFTPDNRERERIWETIFAAPIWLDLDRGDLTEAQAEPELVARSGLDPQRLRSLLQLIKQSMHPVETSHALFREVGALGLNRYCLSNMSHDSYASLRRRYDFFEHFHGIMISAEVRINKPDTAIFRLLLQRFGLSAARTLFLDDNEDNIAAAQSEGIDGILFDRSDACFAEIRRRVYDAHPPST